MEKKNENVQIKKRNEKFKTMQNFNNFKRMLNKMINFRK